ncbi:hypothetical protein VNO77_25389 [Canavalia gladiata]|uniref:Uncharacterized protein n=1 Tax=Canavalia gladiata TaxID=3824 RepID=A0AAN9QDH6_CANGL
MQNIMLHASFVVRSSCSNASLIIDVFHYMPHSLLKTSSGSCLNEFHIVTERRKYWFLSFALQIDMLSTLKRAFAQKRGAHALGGMYQV